MKRALPELLAPAGDAESLEAAIAAGAVQSILADPYTTQGCSLKTSVWMLLVKPCAAVPFMG